MSLIKEINATNNYILIVLEDKRKFKISEDDFFEYKYRANQSLSSIEINKLEKIANFHAAYLKALDRLKYKDRTEYEIRQTLYDGYNLIKPDVDLIIEKLKRYDYINDIRYINDFVRQSDSKLHGFNKVKDGLIQVKISSTLIENHLHYDENKELSMALQFIEKSLNTIKNHNQSQTINKLRSRLLYRGFNNSVINEVLAKIEIPYDYEAEKILLKKDYDKIMRRYKNKYEKKTLKNKLFNHLAGRGYKYEIINELLEEMESNYE